MIRSILILAAASCLLGSSAQAASSCPPGFSMLQDSSACVRISGRVRAETIVRSPRNRGSDSFTNQAGGRVQLDVRKQTEYGPLRGVISVQGITR